MVKMLDVQNFDLKDTGIASLNNTNEGFWLMNSYVNPEPLIVALHIFSNPK